VAGKKSITAQPTWVRVNFVLEPETAERLREVAFHLGENQSKLLRRVLKDYFAQPQIRKLPRRSAKRD